MPEPTASSSQPAGGGDTAERRRHLALRALVEEMLTGIRDATRSDAWTAEERERAQADLGRIMEDVRRAAFQPGGDTPAA